MPQFSTCMQISFLGDLFEPQECAQKSELKVKLSKFDHLHQDCWIHDILNFVTLAETRLKTRWLLNMWKSAFTSSKYVKLLSLRKVLTAVSISCRIFLALPNLEQEVFHFLS